MFDDNKVIKFELVTPEKVVLKDCISQVTVPTKEGEITVLPKHMPLVAMLVPGVLEIINNMGEKKVVAVSGGFLEVLLNKVVVLADTAERSEEIDLERAEKAREWAEREIREQSGIMKDEKHYAEVFSGIERQLARIKAARRHQSRGKSIHLKQD